MPNEKGTVKVSVNLHSESIDSVQAYAAKYGITMTEAINQAIGLQKFLTHEVVKGSKVLLEHKDGSLHRVIL